MKLSWPDKTDLRFIITGGDQLTQYPSNDIPFAVINQYGPSENTVVTTDCYVPVGVTTGTPSIGRPIANTEVYVLDSHLQLVPIGVIGDLYIEGRVLHVDMLIVRILQRKNLFHILSSQENVSIIQETKQVIFLMVISSSMDV